MTNEELMDLIIDNDELHELYNEAVFHEDKAEELFDALLEVPGFDSETHWDHVYDEIQSERDCLEPDDTDEDYDLIHEED